MKKVRTSQNGNALVVIVLVAVVALAGLLGWYAWQNMSTKSTSEVSKATKSSKTSDTADRFLEVNEWGVKLPLTKDIEGVSYTYSSSGKTSSIAFRSPLVKACDSGLGIIVRGPAGVVYYTAPDGTDVSFNAGDHKVGDFYYVFMSPQAPCSDDSDTGGMQREANIVKALEAATKNIVAA